MATSFPKTPVCSSISGRSTMTRRCFGYILWSFYTCIFLWGIFAQSHISPFSILHSLLWKDPHSFNLDRFLSTDGTEINKMEGEKVVTFGLGKRRCIGEVIARNEVFLFLVNFIQKLHFDKTPGAPLDMTPCYGLTMKHKPCHLKATMRVSSEQWSYWSLSVQCKTLQVCGWHWKSQRKMRLSQNVGHWMPILHTKLMELKQISEIHLLQRSLGLCEHIPVMFLFSKGCPCTWLVSLSEE